MPVAKDLIEERNVAPKGKVVLGIVANGLVPQHWECRYDTLKEWLDNACTADLVLLQETHWGFGREDQEWTLTHWSVITSADPRNRFAGVAILLRKSRFPAQGLSHCTWIPGRLLQVRYRDDYITVDAVVGYQWVWQERDKDKIAKQREHFWTQLSKLCQGIPARHLLFLGADFNSVCRPISGLVGRGVLKTTRPAEPALDTLLDEQKLVLLNTWSSSQPKWCFTFKHGSVETQIDFLAVRRRHADDKAQLLRQKVQQALVVASVRNMWTAHRAMSMRGRAVSVRNVVAAWKQYVLFRRAYQALRQASRNRRASWLEAQVISAEEAAQRNDIATVYRIVNQIAPKKRRDRVRIRSAAGHILSAEQEYEEIFRYFSRAFQRDADFEYSTEGLQIVFTAEELGKVESRCYGGIMLSLDLSRAFDELPRAVLLRTLEYAGTPPELCAIIISVHEACKYTVHHGGQVGSFHMAKGVRQGCTLAPLLYSLYTCWLYDELSRRTDEVWAARLLTLFADDTHVPFEIECAADLGFAVRAIRCVFSLFKETGMVVNAGKSKVVVGLRGSAARRWLRRRCCVTDGSTALNFGTPHDPLVIPRVAYDARALRAIARSPVHLTRESNVTTAVAAEDAFFQGIPPATPLVASAQSSTALYADADFIRDLRADWRAVVAKDNIKLKMADPMAVETKATVAQAELDLVFGSPASKEGVQEDRPPKWTKQEGGKGAQQAWGGWGNRSKRQWEPTTQSSEGVPDKQTQALLQVATRLILRHESELARLRADTSFVLFIDTGSHSCLQMLRDAGSRWSDLYAKGQVTMPLRTMLMMGLVQSLKQTIDEVRRSEERLARCKDAGWILEGSLPINPNWVYFGWDPKQKQQVVLETDAVSTSDILTMLDSMESLLRKDGVLQNFKSAKQPEELENAEVAPFVLTISLRTQAADEMHHIFSRLSGNACCKLLGFRVRPERIVRQPLAKQLETKFQETAFCDWKSNANWRARAAT
ncbi:unnamed protein product [Symbiodinium microadriaticum]|nr:unnamed protein product [Symbiodinium microadriaticum]